MTCSPDRPGPPAWRRALACAALVATLTGVGCGGDPDEDAVRAVLTGSAEALVRGDFDTACNFLSEPSRRSAQAGGGCERLLEGAARSGRLREELEDYEVESITVDGDTAVARDSSSRPETRLRRIGGEWKVVG